MTPAARVSSVAPTSATLPGYLRPTASQQQRASLTKAHFSPTSSKHHKSVSPSRIRNNHYATPCKTPLSALFTPSATDQCSPARVNPPHGAAHHVPFCPEAAVFCPPNLYDNAPNVPNDTSVLQHRPLHAVGDHGSSSTELEHSAECNNQRVDHYGQPDPETLLSGHLAGLDLLGTVQQLDFEVRHTMKKLQADMRRCQHEMAEVSRLSERLRLDCLQSLQEAGRVRDMFDEQQGSIGHTSTGSSPDLRSQNSEEHVDHSDCTYSVNSVLGKIREHLDFQSGWQVKVPEDVNGMRQLYDKLNWTAKRLRAAEPVPDGYEGHFVV